MSKPRKPAKPPPAPEPAPRPPQPGRGAGGKFIKGNKLGKGGSPYASQALKLKTELLRASTPAAMRKIVKRLIDTATDGEGDDWRFAVKQYLDRMLGNTAQGVYLSDQHGEAVDPPSLDEAVSVLMRHNLGHLVPPARRAHAKTPEGQP
ncbi:MAG: hypothetical protein IT469_01770 [Pseudomonadales bacterium]|nr:hypothetical protein [Pseudomonadales bacterium]